MFKKIILRTLMGILMLLALGVGGIFLFGPEMNMPLAVIRGVDADATVVKRRIKVPEGYRLSLFAKDLGNARFMRVTSQGDVLISTTRSGEVHLLKKDRDGDGQSDDHQVLLTGLKAPHGLELRDGWLYVAESDAVKRIKFDATSGQVSGELDIILPDLPVGGNHDKKTLRFGPDGWLYLNIGSSCNVCIEEDHRRATMARVHPDGSGFEIIARGLRNSVGFDWSPVDGTLYATNNGRDMLGGEFPTEELNRIEIGKFYGWPYVNGMGIADPDFGDQGGELAKSSVLPAHEFAAHNAPLGITFLRSARHPVDFRNNAIVALHGSWNRDEKDGYKVVRLAWQPDGSITQSDFMTGLLVDDNVIGRPVDVVEDQDGVLYISDDLAGAVYRLSYGEEGGSADIAIETDATPIEAKVFDVDMIAKGEALYDENICVSCHAKLGNEAAEVVLQDLASRYDQAALIALLKSPPSSMPQVDFSNQELEEISAYLLSQ
jgi:glucose/arabinose dehydrogenase